MSASLYDIEHTTSLDAHQRRLIALGITKLHCTAFTVAPLSVHVKFTRAGACSAEYKPDYFVGGQTLGAAYNRILAYVSDGEHLRVEGKRASRLIQGIGVLWDSYVCGGKEIESARLHAVLVLPAVVGNWIKPGWSMDSQEDTSRVREGREFSVSRIKRSMSCKTHMRERVYGCENPSSVDKSNIGVTKPIDFNRMFKEDAGEAPSSRGRLCRKAKFYKF